MTKPRDAYWDELGIAWTAIEPDLRASMPRMKRHLRWQTLGVAAVLFGGVPVGIAGGVLGIWTIWLGLSTGIWNFATRGAAILVTSLLIAAVGWSSRGALRDNTETLSAMVELTLLRAEKWRLAIRLGYASCVVAAALGMIGYGIRVHFGKPPVMSPVEPMVVLAVLGLVLVLLHCSVRGRIAKYRYLRRLLQE
jgi:heme A synthase